MRLKPLACERETFSSLQSLIDLFLNESSTSQPLARSAATGALAARRHCRLAHTDWHRSRMHSQHIAPFTDSSGSVPDPGVCCAGHPIPDRCCMHAYITCQYAPMHAHRRQQVRLLHRQRRHAGARRFVVLPCHAETPHTPGQPTCSTTCDRPTRARAASGSSRCPTARASECLCLRAILMTQCGHG